MSQHRVVVLVIVCIVVASLIWFTSQSYSNSDTVPRLQQEKIEESSDETKIALRECRERVASLEERLALHMSNNMMMPEKPKKSSSTGANKRKSASGPKAKDKKERVSSPESAAKKKKDLVIGLADLNWWELYRFLASLRSTGSDADVVFFRHEDPDHRIKKIYETWGPAYHLPFTSADSLDTTHRFVMYHQYLQEHEGEYGKVLFLDVRDLFFQRNPFDFIEHGLYLTRETVRTKIGICPHNSGWIREAYGQQVVDELKDQYVLCSGVIGGTIDVIVPFMELLMRELKHDQGSLNYLHYKGRLKEFDETVLTVEDGPVLHCHSKLCVDVEKPEWRNAEGEFLNHGRTQVASIVHQYDRCLTIRDIHHANYPLPIPEEWCKECTSWRP